MACWGDRETTPAAPFKAITADLSKTAELLWIRRSVHGGRKSIGVPPPADPIRRLLFYPAPRRFVRPLAGKPQRNASHDERRFCPVDTGRAGCSPKRAIGSVGPTEQPHRAGDCAVECMAWRCRSTGQIASRSMKSTLQIWFGASTSC